MRLLIDQGNTRLKWRLVDGAGQARAAGASATLDWMPLTGSTAVCGSIADIWVASVLGQETQRELAAFLFTEYGCKPNFARVVATCLGVKPAYNDLSKLGVDRWLGFLSAYKVCQQDCVVVSAGTAITVDFVDRGGQHLGGLIFPGAALMREALRQKSFALQSTGLSIPPAWSPGCSTLECIEAGVAAGIAGFAQQIEAYAMSCFNCPEVFVSGGNAAAFAAHLRGPHQICEGLVLDGLYLLSSVQ